MMKFHRSIGWVFSVMLALPATAETVPLTTLKAIHSLTNTQAGLALPVAFAGVVTYYVRGNVDLFIQDGHSAIYVETTPFQNVVPGDLVFINGTTRASFRPEVKADTITIQGHRALPPPVRADFHQLIRAQLDCQRATVHGFVRGANIVNDVGNSTVYLQLQMKGGTVDAEVPRSGPVDLTALLDSEVDITGAVAGRFDRKMQMTGIVIEVPSFADLRFTRRALTAPNRFPITPMDKILDGYDVQNNSARIKVQGTITYYQPGSMLVLQSGDKSLQVITQFEQPARIGDLGIATGFPDVQNGSLVLTSAAIEDSNTSSHVDAINSSANVLARGDHALDLVSIEGRLLTAVRDSAHDEYLFNSEGHLFKAILQHPQHFDAPLSSMREIPVGSRVRIVGVCKLSKAEQSQEPTTFDILLRSPEDLIVISGPSLLNVKNLIYLVGILLSGLVIIGSVALLAGRRGHNQITRLARTEQLRNRVLEHLNSSVNLLELVEKAAEIVSFRLSGAACWCDLVDGGKCGTYPKQSVELRIVKYPIVSRSGVELGVICAAFHAKTKPARIETEALSMAAGLITLAIESRRLYADLQHRSEFDLLTELHNRFSLEKRLGQMIEQANADEATFGLIYIDLDRFKLINDHYGHQIGDRYLQQAAHRMKHMLRPNDLMARLGGDEFAVLIHDAKRHEEVYNVVARLESCFSNPFTIDGNQILGAASFGVALFPADGSTQDNLLNSADASMYVAKQERRARQRENACADVRLSR